MCKKISSKLLFIIMVSMLFLVNSEILANNTPNPPSSLTFSDITKDSVTLNWQDNSSDEMGFKIFRKLSGQSGDGELIHTTVQNIKTYKKIEERNLL